LWYSVISALGAFIRLSLSEGASRARSGSLITCRL
jgi:hypothetical protein